MRQKNVNAIIVWRSSKARDFDGCGEGTRPMQIDAQQHFWVCDQLDYDWMDDSMGAIRRNFLPAELKPLLEQSGFEGSVLVQARQTLDETRWLLELAEANPFIFGVVGWVDETPPDGLPTSGGR
jgi:predicted TIM-barrel fold metal-dependent hydrolase